MKRNKTDQRKTKKSKRIKSFKGSKYANKCKQSGEGVGTMNKQHVVRLPNGYSYKMYM